MSVDPEINPLLVRKINVLPFVIMRPLQSLIPLFILLVATTTGAAASGVAPHNVVVWDGDQAAKGAGWAHAEVVSLQPQSAVAHSGKTALEMRCKGTQSIWAGWNWVAFAKGAGTDIRAMKRLILWVKHAGTGADLQVNLLCGPKNSDPGQEFDTPEHHTGKVHLLHYCPNLLDGAWHQVAIPLSDLRIVPGYDPTRVAELQLGVVTPEPVDCQFFLDDIGFDDASE